MCGLIGYISKKKFKDKKKLLNTLHHRGPDSKKYVEISEKNEVFLGFNRLSIIDLNERSNQPFIYKNLILCFNGEIYNYKEIRNKLINKKIDFNTKSDTEVLIKSIYHLGLKDTLENIEGMWAFSLYDKKKQKLILCRDRFGEKPLLYYKSKNNIFFASELKTFQILLKKKFEFNKKYLEKFLFNDYRYLNKDFSTHIKNINKIEQGTYIIINNKFKITKKNYFKIKIKERRKSKLIDIKKNIKKKLISLTKNSLISDRPLAFCLSGGVDSSGLISIAKKYTKQKINSFTIYSDDKKYDEFEMVNKTIKKLKIKHNWIKINKDETLNNLFKIIAHRKSPIPTVTSYIQWLMFKEISKHKIKVIVSGNGSDEIFSGYYDHHLAYLNDVKKNKKLFNKSLFNWKKQIKPLIRNNSMKDYINYTKNKNYLKIVKGQNLSNIFAKNKINFSFSEKKYCNSFLKNRMLNEMFFESVPVILQEEDLNAMYFSIENRSPYLNSDLFKYLMNTPVKCFINNGYAKSLLRLSLKKITPNHVINNYEKIGFNISVEKLINFKSRKIREFILKKSNIYKIVDKNKVLDVLNDKAMISKYSVFLFKFINAKIFIDNFNE